MNTNARNFTVPYLRQQHIHDITSVVRIYFTNQLWLSLTKLRQERHNRRKKKKTMFKPTAHFIGFFLKIKIAGFNINMKVCDSSMHICL